MFSGVVRMNLIWLILCGFAIVFGLLNGKGSEINQVLVQVGMDTFDFALPVIVTTCFFNGMMQIAKECSLLDYLQTLLKPFLNHLFPDVPSTDPSLGYIGANIVINMFGLGFAATPSGLKAMEHLQKLNHDKKQASRSMVTFLVLNTAGVTLFSTNILAYRMAEGSLDPTNYLPLAVLSTFCASAAGLLLDRWWNYR